MMIMAMMIMAMMIVAMMIVANLMMLITLISRSEINHVRLLQRFLGIVNVDGPGHDLFCPPLTPVAC